VRQVDILEEIEKAFKGVVLPHAMVFVFPTENEKM